MQNLQPANSEEEKLAIDPEPTGTFLYGDNLTKQMQTIKDASFGHEDELAELGFSQEEAKAILATFKIVSKKVETFRASSPEVTSAELL